MPRIGPVGDVDVMLRQHRLDRAAQQRRVVTRKGRDDQHLRIGRGVSLGLFERILVAGEMHERAKRLLRRFLDQQRNLGPVDDGMVETPFRLRIAPRHILENVEGGGGRPAEPAVGGGVQRRTPEFGPDAGGDARRREGRIGEFISCVQHD